MTGPAQQTSGGLMKSRLVTWALLVLILAAAGALRLFNLRDEAAWHDEVVILVHLDSRTLPEFLERIYPYNPTPPLYFITQYLWSRVVGTSVPALRLLSIAYGLAGMVVLFLVGKRLSGAPASLIACAWIGLAYWHIYQSQELRYYALVMFLAPLSMLVFLRMLEVSTMRRLAVETVVSLLLVWTHPIAVFLFVPKGLILLGYHHRDRTLLARWFAAHIAVAGTLVVFMASVDHELAYALTGWLPKPTFWGRNPSVRGLLQTFSGAPVNVEPTNALGNALAPIRAWLISALMLASLIMATLGAFTLYKEDTSNGTLKVLPGKEFATLLLLWLIVPPVLAFAVSHAWRPTFMARYLLFSTFPLYILIGSWLANRRPATIVIVLGLFAVFSLAFSFPGPLRAPYDDLAADMDRIGATGDVVHTDNMIISEPLRFYTSTFEPELVSFLETEAFFDEIERGLTSPPVGHWFVFTRPGRYRFTERYLNKHGITFQRYAYPAGKPLQAIYIPSAKPATSK